jgi:hypothetical protein
MVQTPTRSASSKPKPKTQYPIGISRPDKPTVEQLERWEVAQITLIKESGYDYELDTLEYKRKNIKIVIHKQWNKKQIRDEIDRDPSNWAYDIVQVYRANNAYDQDW